MTSFSFHDAYKASGLSVHDLFDSIEEGFYVPLYQREYTWEEDNINQLFEDIIIGIRELIYLDQDKATTFLGTTILTDMVDKTDCVADGDVRAQPTGVSLVIDGQQRLSTIAILSIQLIERLVYLGNLLPIEPPYISLKSRIDEFTESLRKLYSIKIGSGATPSLKPKIIKASKDQWTFCGNDDTYRSPVARYIATFIRSGSQDAALDAITSSAGTRLILNIKLINEWLKNIENAHIPGTPCYEQFPVGEQIVSESIQEYVFKTDESSLIAAIVDGESDTESPGYNATAIYQLLLLAYYLLRRCGVNVLRPTHEEWGFDMFQALNATGTPLTAMETFLPQVMQAEIRSGNVWASTESAEFMSEIDKLFERTKTNEQKNRRTNELLSTLALCYSGDKLSYKFSAQRKWMTQVFENERPEINQKREFLYYLANVARFYHLAWYMEEVNQPYLIKDLENHEEGKLVSFLIQYLKDANSKLSAPILSLFYERSLNNQCMNEFVGASKACAAFFTLWRSARSTSGLDQIYRNFFKGSSGSVEVAGHNWMDNSAPVSLDQLKAYFSGILQHHGINERDLWISASENLLAYTEVRAICRFVLFLAGHNQIPDTNRPGLTTPGRSETCEILDLEHWNSSAFKTLEHVAPQNQSDEDLWDNTIYSENKIHQIGNLILLPADVNQFVERKSWKVKYLHYCHLGVRSQIELDRLQEEANAEGIVLSRKATKSLSEAGHNCTIEPIYKLGKNGVWNADFIDSRTQQIKEIAWNVLTSWLVD